MIVLESPSDSTSRETTPESDDENDENDENEENEDDENEEENFVQCSQDLVSKVLAVVVDVAVCGFLVASVASGEGVRAIFSGELLLMVLLLMLCFCGKQPTGIVELLL